MVRIWSEETEDVARRDSEAETVDSPERGNAPPGEYFYEVFDLDG